MARTMSADERRTFLAHGTRTGVLSTVRPDGSPHAAPVWFVLDGDDIVFNTNRDTVKGRNLRRTGTAAFVVDDGVPPYSFVTVTGAAEISEDPAEMLRWATAIAARYMGADLAEQYGRRNAVPGELLVRLVPRHTVAIAALAD
ncbi:MAG TPA: PPOX class F420-dependent oxidoreductase [Jatrophihabitans sp.]|nr:PPOX class F420-dependent oxidoreductase [Jatrophihabitans sp.]